MAADYPPPAQTHTIDTDILIPLSDLKLAVAEHGIGFLRVRTSFDVPANSVTVTVTDDFDYLYAERAIFVGGSIPEVPARMVSEYRPNNGM
jgi:hypothetical protein